MHTVLSQKLVAHILVGIIGVFLIGGAFQAYTPHRAGAEVGSGGAGPGAQAAAQAQGQADKAKAADASIPKNNPSASAWYMRIGTYVGYAMLGVASMVTYIGGSMLEASIDTFVINIRTFLIGSSFGTALESIWQMIRDIANILFIFGFIYCGIRTIIDAGSADTKRMISRIIIAALLINFSLFFVRVIVDISNYIAVAIYSTLTTPAANGSTNIAAKFAELLGITGYFGPPDANAYTAMTNGGGLAFYFMGSVMLIIAGFVFSAGATLLMIRFAMLVFIMIFSPLLFAATIFPQTKGIADDLWKKLFHYAFFAPAYLLMLIVTIKILETFSIQVNPAQGKLRDGLMVGTTDSFAVILNFAVVIMFLILSLQIASKFGIRGADTAVAMSKKLLGATTAGLAARAGRAIGGRGANWVAEQDWLKDRAAGNKGNRLTGWAARRTLKGSRVVADSSFDARNVKGVGGKLGVGEGRKGGYQTVQKEMQESEEKFARSLGEVDDKDAQVMARKKEMEASEKDVDKSKDAVSSLQNKKNAAERDRRKAEAARSKVANGTPAAAALDAEIATLTTEIGDVERDMATARDAVKQAEKDATDAKIKYESEKQRRIIGSTYASDKAPMETQLELKRQADAIQTKKNQIQGQWDGIGAGVAVHGTKYGDLKDNDPVQKAAKEARRKEVARLQKQLEDLENDRTAYINDNIKDRGYAGVLERSSVLTTWPVGRSQDIENHTGEEIRRTASRGLPKKKED